MAKRKDGEEKPRVLKRTNIQLKKFEDKYLKYLLQGMKQRHAYLRADKETTDKEYEPISASWDCDYLDREASEFKAKIKGRYDELKEARDRESKEYLDNKAKEIGRKVVEELESLAFSDLNNYINWSANGAVIKDSNEIDTRAVQEVTIKDGEVKIKLYGKNDPLKKLGEFAKIFNTEGVNININKDLESKIGEIEEDTKEVDVDG